MIRNMLNTMRQISHHEHIDLPRQSRILVNQRLPLLPTEIVQNCLITQNFHRSQPLRPIDQSQLPNGRARINRFGGTVFVIQRRYERAADE